MKPNSITRNMTTMYNELHNNFFDYINANKLQRKVGLNYRTIKSYLNVMKNLGLFHAPICEWHIEEVEEEIKKSEEKK